MTKHNQPNRTWLTIIVGLFIFVFGYSLGNGSLQFNRTSSLNQQLPNNLDYAEIEQVYDSLRDNYAGELDINKLLDGLKEGLAKASGDPYTEYLNKEAAAQFDDDLSGTFTGIGAELGLEDEFVIVVAPLAGFPAEKAGLRARDVITKIDGESAHNLSITEAVKKIRGPEGTDVALTIVRGGSEELDFKITRQEIKIPSVESEVLEGNIALMRVSRFGEDTARLARQAAEDFKARGVKGIVLDLRSNPGGLLEAAVDLSGLWLDKGEVVLEEKRDGQTLKTYRADGQTLLAGLPTVVLVDEGSASASEITAGALQDNDVATLIGAETFGKGSVQRLIDFGDGTKLKVTIARWFTPGGRNIDQEGVTPDQEVIRTLEDFENDRDPQLATALEYLKK